MFLYRVVLKDNTKIINSPWKGINTFQYENNKEYLHFYFFPEHAEFLQKTKYYNKESTIIKCDIPLDLLEFGIGLYNYYFTFQKSPFLEARIEYDKFDESFIIEKKDTIDDNWKNPLLYKRYLKKCVYGDKPYYIIDKNDITISIVNDFDFLYYIDENYYINKKEELKFIKKVLYKLYEKKQKTKEKKLIK